MANLGVITALASLSKVVRDDIDEGTSIYSARLNHASIVDGIRLASKQSSIHLTLFDTEDLQHLEAQLMADPIRHKLIVCDGVFSMDGHLSPVKALLDLATRFDALLLIDDAHGFGVLGEKGHGLLEHLGLNSERLIYLGTLGKAAGVFGAFVCAHQSLCTWIFQKARAYIYTTATPAAFAQATLKSLDIIEGAEGQEKRAHLKHLIARWENTLHLKHWTQLSSPTPIQPVLVGDNQVCLQLDQTLQAMGYLIPAIRPPTVPPHTARLRITFCANHSTEEVESLAQVLMDLEKKVAHP
jgi:8-amino-7-oxononanoate synthase